MHLKAWIMLAMLVGLSVMADEIPFSKFNMLDDGMSVAEVLLRVGKPDHEDVVENRFGAKQETLWYYTPQTRSGWITIIHFDRFGRVIRIERDRP
jgi:hypothetical protein